MLNQSNEEKEFYGKQKSINKIEIDLSKLSDREIQEKQLILLTEINNSNLRTKSNIQFFFYLTIVSILLGLLIIFNKM